jgi:hypothetical protein
MVNGVGHSAEGINSFDLLLTILYRLFTVVLVLIFLKMQGMFLWTSDFFLKQ